MRMFWKYECKACRHTFYMKYETVSLWVKLKILAGLGDKIACETCGKKKAKPVKKVTKRIRNGINGDTKTAISDAGQEHQLRNNDATPIHQPKDE